MNSLTGLKCEKSKNSSREQIIVQGFSFFLFITGHRKFNKIFLYSNTSDVARGKSFHNHRYKLLSTQKVVSTKTPEIVKVISLSKLHSNISLPTIPLVSKTDENMCGF